MNEKAVAVLNETFGEFGIRWNYFAQHKLNNGHMLEVILVKPPGGPQLLHVVCYGRDGFDMYLPTKDDNNLDTLKGCLKEYFDL